MRPAERHKTGFVLVSVLWITAMLTLIILGFGRRAALDRRAAAYALDQAEAMMMARGAVDRGVVELYNRGLMLLLLPEDQRGGTHLGESWAQTNNLFEEGYFEQTELYENDVVAYIITDEDRFININMDPTAPGWDVLEEIDALSRPVLRRIRARHDTMREEKRMGFNAVEELRYVRGVREDDWFGTHRTVGLKRLLTVWGDGRINVNTASREVLACIPGLRSGDINTILNYRAGGDGVLNTGDDRGFENPEDLTDKTGVTGASREALDKYCKYTSSHFRITGVATRRQGRVRAVCSAIVSYESEFMVIDWQEKTLGS